MVRVRSTTRLPVGGRLTAALVVVAIGAATGCTMCPDPLDYSGPVPNGSAPQNDFRARSGGILRLGGAPRPWPQVVQADGVEADSETAVGEDVTVETVSVLQTAGRVAGNDEPLAPSGAGNPAMEATPPDLQPAAEGEPAVEEHAVEEAAADATTASEAAGSDLEPPAEPLVPAEPPAASETPGWRPRR